MDVLAKLKEVNEAIYKTKSYKCRNDLLKYRRKLETLYFKGITQRNREAVDK